MAHKNFFIDKVLTVDIASEEKETFLFDDTQKKKLPFKFDCATV